MKQELTKVEFHGDVLEAVEQGGKIVVSLRRCCENLGLAFESQLAKLKGKAWATMTEIVMVAEDGKQRVVTAIDLDTLPMWLAGIDARRVREESREKLARYQREAARVLADHFFRRREAEGDAAFVTVGSLKSLFAAFREELGGMLESRPAAPALPAPGSYPAVPRFTVGERLRFKGWFTATKKQRATIRRLANALLDSRHQETPDILGGYTFWYAHQLACLDEAIDRVKADAERTERAGGPRLPGTA